MTPVPRNVRAGFVAGLLLAAALPPATAAASQWMLMSRHGECAEIAALERKIPDLGEVRDPEAFVNLMRARGHTVFAKGQLGTAGRMVEVLVPDRQLSLIFVTEDACRPGGAR